METAAHPRSLFKPRTFGKMFVTLSSSASLWSGVVKTFRCRALMLSSEQIADRVAGQIYFVYSRPLIHAPHNGVDHLLYAYHWVWSSATECDFQFSELAKSMYAEHNSAHSVGLWQRFWLENPDASDDDGLAYVLSCWRDISDKIGVPDDGPHHPKRL